MRESKQQEYTVFANLGRYNAFENTEESECHDSTIAGIICWYTASGYTPVAWAPEMTAGYGGAKHPEELRAESIAAGRLIKKIDGKWVALGVEKPERSLADAAQDITITYDEFIALSGTDPNAAMIARDGPAKPIMPAIFFGIDYAAGCAPAPVSTAKPAISGLQREYSSTHLLGSYR